MIDQIEGIVIKETPYRETSKVIQIITKDYGIISCLAKGSRSLKSELRTVTTKMTYGIFHMHYKEGKLSTLMSVDVVHPLKEIKKDITKISYASFILELTEQVIKQSIDSEIYPLLIASLRKIEEGYDPLVITNILELKYLFYLGVAPILDACSICGSKKSIATLSSDRGGYVCNDCLNNEVMVSEKTIKLIRMFFYVDISKITTLEITDFVKKEINQFLDSYYDRYTGLYLKSKAFLKNLSKTEIL